MLPHSVGFGRRGQGGLRGKRRQGMGGEVSANFTPIGGAGAGPMHKRPRLEGKERPALLATPLLPPPQVGVFFFYQCPFFLYIFFKCPPPFFFFVEGFS